MGKTKELLITSFALFAMFFGAGNLLLPPLLGYKAADAWSLVTLGFIITAVFIPILGIYAHAKLQGTMYDFAKKVSPVFSVIFCIVIYLISVTLPSPRTAAATHEIAIGPMFGTSSLLTSFVYFALVLLFALNRSKILSLIGKYLTPFIVIILLLVIGIGLFASPTTLANATLEAPLVDGILEGYQTFDAIGAVVVGAVIIISLNLRGHNSYSEKKTLITKAGIIAGIGLLIMYTGLIATGAYFGSEISLDPTMSSDMQRANLLRGISIKTLGDFGNTVLSVLISLACLTTAVSIVTGAADYFRGLFGDSKKVYTITAIVGCAIGVLVGQMDFHSIIVVAIPVLAFIYPLVIVLIFLNAIPDKWASPKVFKAVAITTFLFSVPDVISGILGPEAVSTINSIIPLAKYSMGWVLPAVLAFLAVNTLFKPVKSSNLQN
jgi:LIVCS family branched-chain amino acid:cation transporter